MTAGYVAQLEAARKRIDYAILCLEEGAHKNARPDTAVESLEKALDELDALAALAPIARLEAVAEAAHDYLMDGGGSTAPLRDALGALAALAPAGDTITLTGEQAEKVRAYIVECRDWFGDDPVAMSLRDEADPVLSLLSRGQEK